MRGQRRERLGEVEVVRELGARLLFALADPRGQPPTRPHPFAQRADQISVLAEPLRQGGADSPVHLLDLRLDDGFEICDLHLTSAVCVVVRGPGGS